MADNLQQSNNIKREASPEQAVNSGPIKSAENISIPPRSLVKDGIVDPQIWQTMSPEERKRVLESYYGSDYNAVLGLIPKAHEQADNIEKNEINKDMHNSEPARTSNLSADGNNIGETATEVEQEERFESMKKQLDELRSGNFQEINNKENTSNLSEEEQARIFTEKGGNANLGNTQGKGNITDDSTDDGKSDKPFEKPQSSTSTTPTVQLFGYKPSWNLFQNYSAIADKGKAEDAETWLAILLRKLLLRSDEE